MTFARQPDLDQARSFVAALTGHADTPCTWQTFDDGPDKRPGLARIFHGPLSIVTPSLIEMNGLGAGVFMTINATDLRGRRLENVTGLRACFVDFDNGPPDCPITPTPSVLVQSASGPHIYWRLIPGEPLALFKDAQQALISVWKSDRQICDLNRVMRVPGFWHLKDPSRPFQVQLVGTTSTVYTIAELAPTVGILTGAAVPPSPPTMAAARTADQRGQPCSGDLRTLDIGALFRGRAMYRKPLGAGKDAVVCPWNDDHSRPTAPGNLDDTSTVVWTSDGTGWPGFRCLHSHCADRSIVDVLEFFGAAEVDTHCGGTWVPEVHADLIARAQSWRQQVRESAERAAQEALARKPPATIERVQLVTERDTLDMLGDAIDALAKHPEIYTSGGQLARIGPTGSVELLTRGAVESLLVDVAEFLKVTNQAQLKPASVPDVIPRILLSPSGRQLAPFRHLDMVTKTPFWTASGRAVTEAGYNAEARTVLIDPPPVQDDLFPSARAAVAWIYQELLADFPFGSEAERANFLGAMLVPMVRSMINGPVPLHNIEANKRGTGKSLLAQVLMVVYGLNPELGPLPKDEAEREKRVLGVLRDGHPIHVWDNVDFAVRSAVLDVILTSRFYTGRQLGVNTSLRFPVLQLWIMTSNNARLSEDTSRRTVRSRLLSPVEFPEDRAGFRHADILAWAEERRPEILSALFQVVGAWIKDGRPLPPPEARRALGSFHAFAQVVGSILYHAGEGSWLGNLKESRDEANMDAEEWPPFLEAWAERYGTQPTTAKQLWEICNETDAMIDVRGGGSDLSQIKRLSNAIIGSRDGIRFGFRIRVDKDDHRKGLRFTLTPVDKPVSASDWRAVHPEDQASFFDPNGPVPF